jgi:NADPH:quinone reductase
MIEDSSDLGVLMRRVRFYEYGGPDVLRVEDAEAPQAGPGELLVQTEAIGVTLPSVRKVRGEGAAALPGMLGGEVAGQVAALGPGVTGFEVGDRVTGISFAGSYAELVVVPAFVAECIPEGVSATQAVALMRSGHVALAALSAAQLDVDPGWSVLITGAASGVGHLAVQLARLQGAGRVVAAVSSPQKADFLRKLGADEVVTYDSENWGEPVGTVLEGIGGDLLPRALAALAADGRMVFFGSGGGTVPAFDLLAGAKTITGLSMGRFLTAKRELYDRHGKQLWELALAGKLQPAVYAEFPLADAAKAHAVIESRANLGKVVLHP